MRRLVLFSFYTFLCYPMGPQIQNVLKEILVYNEYKTRKTYNTTWGNKHGYTKLDNKLPQNVQNITWSHKHYRENYENLESGIESRTNWNKGDALSPWLFIIVMMSLNHILIKSTAGYKLSTSQEKINHLMYMDDIKLFAKKMKKNWKL